MNKMIAVRKIVNVLIPIVIGFYVYNRDTFDSKSIRGKRVLVTGASSGIGEQVAYKYARLGAKLVITARRADLLTKISKHCEDLGAKFIYSFPADMAKASDRVNLVSTVEKVLGGIDILILNHAVMDPAFWANTPENQTQLEYLMNVNFFSYVDISSRLLDSLVKSKGYIGVVSSMIGKNGIAEFTSYCAAKHALQGFYSSLRQELRIKKCEVSITIMVFGLITSEHALKLVSKRPFRKMCLRVAGSVEGSAEALVKGVANRVYEVYYPFYAQVGIFFMSLCPNILGDILYNGYIDDW